MGSYIFVRPFCHTNASCFNVSLVVFAVSAIMDSPENVKFAKVKSSLWKRLKCSNVCTPYQLISVE